MKTTKPFFIIFILLIAALCAFSCSRRPSAAISGSDYTPTPTPTLMPGYGAISGSLSLPAAAEGKNYYIYVFSQFDGFSSAEGSASGVCGADSAVPFYLGVPAGSYYIAAFVDIDGSGASPSPGDLVGVYGALWPAWPADAGATVTGGGNINPSITLVAGAANTTGVITLYTDAPGSMLHVYMDLDTDITNGNNAATAACTLSLGPPSYEYNMLVLVPGNYYVYGWVDMDGSSGPLNSGDQLGYFGVCSCNPTAAPSFPNVCPDFSILNYYPFILGMLP